MNLTLRPRTTIAVSILLLALFSNLFLLHAGADSRPPQADLGIAGLRQELKKLQTTARLMHTTAHPDDEDGGMLALESRGMGADVMLFTLNRGEGGQNKTGKELFDALGVLRTLELLRADDYYGVHERFSHVVDFGFSKNANETFEKWRGHDTALEDMVRAIRTFRPDVLVARFQGAPRDGHGHHQASGILTREAFKVAGDPNMFPDQISQGLVPWQPKKLYTDNVKPDEEYTLKLDTGAYDPALGMSYLQFALEGLSHQLSQGSGGARVLPGHHYSLYKLLESNVPTPGSSPGGHEKTFFDGIDTSLTALSARLGPEAIKIPFLAPALDNMTQVVAQANAAFTPDNPARAASPLLAGYKFARELIDQIKSSELSPVAKAGLLVDIETKREQFERAANLALGVDLDVSVDAPPRNANQPAEFPGPQSTFAMAVPGQTFTITAHFYNRSPRPVSVEDIYLEVPPGWKSSTLKKDLKTVGADDEASEQFQITVPADAPYTRPYWSRTDTQESIYKIDDPRYITLPFPPAPVRAIASYTVAGSPGEISSAAQVKYIDPLYGQGERALVVGPSLSVEVQPPDYVIPVGAGKPFTISVGVRSNAQGAANGTLRLEVPAGWRAEPATEKLSLARNGDFDSFKFSVTPAASGEGRYSLKAVADLDGKQYSEGYTVIGRHDLDTFYYYQPAIEKISAVSFKAPGSLKVGYVMGAGDDIPETLRQLGLSVQMMSEADLATGDLSRFDAIVLGIRAYDVRSDLRDNNKRLLEYVSNGGVLVVQYNQNTQVFNSGGYAPYPMTASAAKRVTVEEAPVQVLEPQDPMLHYPNEITSKDFDGWVQERGVYFMEKWDPRYKALLASGDPGEEPLPGGLLKTTVGKGTYVYTGYAFFRQLPAGVPGAIRLFINILYAGRQG